MAQGDQVIGLEHIEDLQDMTPPEDGGGADTTSNSRKWPRTAERSIAR